MMNAVALDNLLWQYRHELFFYPWKLFELRIQEEMLRADRSGSGFAYMELRFARIEKLQVQVSAEDLWREILRLMAENFRGSDIKGYLEDNVGIGVVFLDSELRGAVESVDRILRVLKRKGWLAEDVTLDRFARITAYPQHNITQKSDNISVGA